MNEHTATYACFYCGADSDFIREQRLGHPDDPSQLDADLGAPRLGGSGIVLRAGACARHDDALADAIMDRFGSASGWGIDRLGSNCPDPFHEGGQGEVVHTDVGRGIRAESYRCPTCGFQTMTLAGHVEVDDAAYRFARSIIDHHLGAPAPK